MPRSVFIYLVAAIVLQQSRPGPLSRADAGYSTDAPPAQTSPPDSKRAPKASIAAEPKPPGKPESQPLEIQPPATASPPSDLLAADLSRGPQAFPGERLAGTPSMFGDFLFPSAGQLFLFSPIAGTSITSDLPLGGGSTRPKVSENNQAWTRDRVYFLYNHFHNAWSFNSRSPDGPQAASEDRYTFGLEKGLGQGLCSVELRMPLSGETEFASQGFAVAGGDVGNLAVFLKGILFQTDCSAACIGLGVDTPTGDDVSATFGRSQFIVRNQAIHLSPFLGYSAEAGCCFFHGFFQVDLPADGNRIDYVDLGTASGSLGKIDEQALLELDVCFGRWLYRQGCGRLARGLASVVEFHYTTALEDAGRLSGQLPLSTTQYQFGSLANRVDIVDLTVGLHGQLGLTACRVGGVFPLTRGTDRAFDAEVQVQLERQF